MFEELSHFRHEHKYVEPQINLIGMQLRLSHIMQIDSHVSEKGYYCIRSLYFDDFHNRYLKENINGVDERVKWRIRIYDRNSSHIFLERKIRKGDLIAKQSCRISTDMFNCITRHNVGISSENPRLLNLFIKEIKITALRPTVIVEYERTPFVCAEGNTRVTIDRNIRSSDEVDAFLEDRKLMSRPVLSSGHGLIEVKYDAFLPDYVAHTIEHGRMRRETFSKYYLACRFPYNGITAVRY